MSNSRRSPYAHLIEHIHDAVVRFDLVDGEPVVREVNAAFEEVFGFDRAAIADERLNEWIVPEWLAEEARDLDASTRDGEINYRRVRRETADGLREFLYRGIPIVGPEDPAGGFAVYTDLTEISRTERQLQVMNRVLRHNLRNKATIILGNTTQLLAAVDDPGEHVQAIADVERAANVLERLAREASEFESLVTSAVPAEATYDLVAEIQAAATAHRERFPTASIEAAHPEALQVKGDGHLRLALDALIENAVTHNPAGDPSVRITAEPASRGWALLAVEDDGPRIPQADRDVVRGDAEISPIRHGTGLGLWLVKWCVERVGGELRFEESDLGGNSVRIRVPTAQISSS